MICLRSASRYFRIAGVFCSRSQRIDWRSTLRLRGFGLAVAVLFSYDLLEAASSADLSLGRPQGSAPDLVLAESGEARSKAMAHYAMALQLESAGKMREALMHYREVIHADPTNAELVAHTAEIAMNYGSVDEALALLKESIDRNPQSAQPRLNLASFLSTYFGDDPKRAAEASEAIKEALTQFPHDAEVYRIAVMLHLTANQREKAIEVMKNGRQQKVERPDFWLALGRVAQEVWPLGQAELKERHRAEVNPFFEKAQQVAGTTPAADAVKLQVAQFYLLTNQLPDATRICETLAARPGNTQAKKMLYRLYEAAGQDEKAYSTLDALVKETPGDPEQRKLLAALCEQRKDFSGAASHLETAIQTGGGDEDDYKALCQLLVRSDQMDRLIQVSQRGTRLFPDQIEFRVFAGVGHRMQKQWEKAIAHFAEADKQAQATAPEQLNYRFYFQYGVTLERAARFDEAAKQFQRSIDVTPKESAPEAANTMNYLGYMWLEQNRNLDKAEELIRRANEIEPGNGAFIDSLGWLFFKKGDYKAALTELLRAREMIVDLQPEDAEIVDHIGQTYLKLGDKAKGIEQLRIANGLDPANLGIKKRLEEAEGKSAPAPPPTSAKPLDEVPQAEKKAPANP